MKVLILGATGFTGTKLCSFLFNMRDIDVTAAINRKQPEKKIDINYVHTSLQDINVDFLVKGDYDYIFHLARIPGKRFGNIGRLYAGIAGSIANKRLLNNIGKMPRQPKLIYLSGSLMYGHNPGHQSVESDKLNPAGFAKYYYLAEQPLLQAMKKGHHNIMMLRAPWIIGKGSWFNQLYANHITRQQSVPVYGNKEREMSFITVEDCAGMLWYYATNAVYNKVYNIYTFKTVLYENFIGNISSAYKCTQFRQYTEEEITRNNGKIAKESICCEVVLDTQYPALHNNYKPLYNNLENYILQLANN